eukprot:1157650-Pelagomonas_calceolata.AAC.4
MGQALYKGSPEKPGKCPRCQDIWGGIRRQGKAALRGHREAGAHKLGHALHERGPPTLRK